MNNCMQRFPALLIAMTYLVPTVEADWNPAFGLQPRVRLGSSTKRRILAPFANRVRPSSTQTRRLTNSPGQELNMWADKDECHMVWKKLDGDFVLEAQVKLLGDGVDSHSESFRVDHTRIAGCRIGICRRRSSRRRSDITQFRRSNGAKTEEVKSNVKAPDVIRLSRAGTKIVMAAARSGAQFQTSEGIDLDLGNEVYVGLFICSHNADVVEKGFFPRCESRKPTVPGTSPPCATRSGWKCSRCKLLVWGP